MISVHSRKAVSEFLDASDAAEETQGRGVSSAGASQSVALSDVKHIAERVGGLSKAMRIVAFNAYYDASTPAERCESFQTFSSEFYRLAQECDRAVREFDSVVKKAVEATNEDPIKMVPNIEREEEGVA
ncbi:MAG: hypothetical protein ACPGN3_00885 [Opitutales bacterium]